MKHLFLDANILLASLNENDLFFIKARKFITHIESQDFSLITSDYVFNEVVGVTFRKKGKDEAKLIGEHIFKSVKLFNINETLLQESWIFFTKTNTNLNLVDCTTAVLVKSFDIPLATYDQEFKKIQGITLL